jgi:hypothetical protein
MSGVRIPGLQSKSQQSHTPGSSRRETVSCVFLLLLADYILGFMAVEL